MADTTSSSPVSGQGFDLRAFVMKGMRGDVALAIGILIDAFLVRMTLTPALMSLFGDKAWWLPRWLDRMLPDLDVEGDRLLRMLTERQDTEVARRPEVIGK